MLIELSEAEALALCGRLEHSPDCIFAIAGTAVAICVAEDGSEWLDAACTRPHPGCTCGYFDLRTAGELKIASAIDSWTAE